MRVGAPEVARELKVSIFAFAVAFAFAFSSWSRGSATKEVRLVGKRLVKRLL